jgi:phospholipase C
MPDIAALRKLVDTVIIVMLENRSFDHMLGHLSLEGMAQVDGLREPFSRYANPFNGSAYLPWSMTDGALSCDLPHEFDEVKTQLALSDVTGRYEMNGFVEAYARAANCMVASSKVEPMAYFSSSQVPITSFFARNFAVCDRWFAPLPTSTQPNKTMALTGDSKIFETRTRPIPSENMVFEWLTKHRVSWRVYAEHISFLMLYDGWAKKALGPKFRSTKQLPLDLLTEPDNTFPHVIFVEPAYDSVESLLGRHGNDNHAPLAVSFGEQFQRKIYNAVIGSPERWKKTVMVLTYDEHGGFFDHVEPLAIPYQVRGEGDCDFASTGPRVPAIVISPLASAGGVCHSNMDHTSVLQFLAELFGAEGEEYSPTVAFRKSRGIRSVSDALTLDIPRKEIVPSPGQALRVSSSFGGRTMAADPMQQAFANAAKQMVADNQKDASKRFPELAYWALTQN